MKLCRYENAARQVRLGLVSDDLATVQDLTAAGCDSLTALLEKEDLVTHLGTLAKEKLPTLKLAEARLLAPVERQEVWAAGVTYLRSKKARKEESDFAATAYEMVYLAPRPELFFKSMPEKVVGTGEPVAYRQDGYWSVPEAELVLVYNSRGQIAGVSLGNDMSARDIEGTNLLYLPQAKIYDRSCAVGPWIVVGPTEAEIRTWKIYMDIAREGEWIFRGATTLDRLKRSFEELTKWLWRCQTFPYGVMLLTGTGIIPPHGFRVQAGDHVTITVEEMGRLENPIIKI